MLVIAKILESRKRNLMVDLPGPNQPRRQERKIRLSTVFNRVSSYADFSVFYEISCSTSRSSDRIVIVFQLLFLLCN